MKKFISLSLFVLGLVFLESCCQDMICITYDDIELKNYSLATLERLEADQAVSRDDYLIELVSTTTDGICFANFSIGSSLAATSCDNWFLNDKVVDISIKSNADLNVSNDKGQELKEFFTLITVNECAKFVDNPEDCITDLLDTELDRTIEKAFNESYTESVFIVSEAVVGLGLKDSYSVVDSIHQFTMEFSFESGVTISATTDEITFE